MSTDRDFAELVVGLLQPEPVRAKAMFGEYCLYHNNKVVAFICDNRVLLKPTAPPLAQVKGLEMAEAYPGSKPYHLVPEDQLDQPWFRDMIIATSDALPPPKPKKKKQPAG